EAPGREAPGREAPGREAPGREAPGREAPGREAPGREAPGREAPGHAVRRPDRGKLRHLKRHLKKIKRLQQSVSRKQKGSQNREKAVKCLARQHRRVTHRRADTLHPLPSRLAKTPSVVVIEGLNVSGLLKNQSLAQAIAEVGFAELRGQL